MTHNADCSVTSVGEDILEDISECYKDANSQYNVQECEELADEFGLEYIGGGEDRAVFRAENRLSVNRFNIQSDECVVKVSKDQTGDLANEWEVDTWDTATPGAGSEIFVPVEDWGDEYEWVSMSTAAIPDGKNVPERMEDRLDAYGWECPDMVPENIGELHDHLVMIDYVGCEQIG